MIRPLPTPPQRNDPLNFAVQADALIAALPDFVDDCNALEGTLQLVATTGTSTSTLTVGNGSKSLVTQPGKAWIVGAVLYVVDPSAPGNIMQGQLSGYNTETGALTVNVQTFAGSGSRSTWVIGLAGVNVGAASTGANTFTGPQTLPGNAVNPLEAVPLQQIEDRLRRVLTDPQVAAGATFWVFSSIPDWAKRVTVIFYGLVSGSSIAVRVGDSSGGVLSSGYSGAVSGVTGFDDTSIFGLESSILIPNTWAGSTSISAERSGAITLTLLGGNRWIFSGCVHSSFESNRSTWTMAGATPALVSPLALIQVSSPFAITSGSCSLLIEG